MQPYLAAAGHNNYTRSLALFIPKMIDLHVTHPEVHAAFMKGLFPVRRSDGPWTGVFTDLFIEQVLMAGIKSTGGLTHGRGFTDTTRLLFLLSRPLCADVSQCICDFAGLSSTAGDGHRDLRASGTKRDIADTQKLLQVLVERRPFSQISDQLVSLSSGLLAEKSVTADDAKSVGEKILTSMVDYKNQVKTLASSIHVKTASGEQIEMDPQRLYQRLLVTGICDTPMEELFMYELCSFPTSLFDTHLLLRTGDKAEIIHYLIKQVPACITASPQPNVQYIVDGGALLHRFPWPKQNSYSDICNMYTRYIRLTYGHALVVFDGYHGSTTKNEAHHRRMGQEVGA